MTSFYWVDTYPEAVLDAQQKSIPVGKYVWFDARNKIKSIDVSNYEAIYLKQGMIELEKWFADIQGKSLCRC